MLKQLENIIKKELNLNHFNYSPLSGGDTNAVYKIEADNKQYVLKLEQKSFETSSLKVEKKGLQLLAKHTKVPTPITCGFMDNTSYLILPYINGKSPDKKNSIKLGKALANLHKNSHSSFGLSYDNYIGLLPQKNGWDNSWGNFYWEKRLQPQFELAIQKKLLVLSETPTKQSILNLLEKAHVKPSLLHGDLWNGNYIISQEGIPYFIDPAVYYGHNEVDIAMSLLFGGFGQSFYDTYFDIIPKQPGFDTRIHLYQLYYLLVHLNIFGSSYLSSVKEKITLIQ